MVMGKEFFLSDLISRNIFFRSPSHKSVFVLILLWPTIFESVSLAHLWSALVCGESLQGECGLSYEKATSIIGVKIKGQWCVETFGKGFSDLKGKAFY